MRPEVFFPLVSFQESRHGWRMNLSKQLVTALFVAGIPGIPVQAEEEKPFHEIWEEQVPVMGHLAVAMNGTVLVF